MSIGIRVKRFREAKGISQDDLALRLDVAQSTISSIESDKSIPNSMLLRNIAKELEIDMNQLFDDKFTNYNQKERWSSKFWQWYNKYAIARVIRKHNKESR